LFISSSTLLIVAGIYTSYAEADLGISMDEELYQGMLFGMMHMRSVK
jgi:hypothetical protein